MGCTIFTSRFTPFGRRHYIIYQWHRYRERYPVYESEPKKKKIPPTGRETRVIHNKTERGGETARTDQKTILIVRHCRAPAQRSTMQSNQWSPAYSGHTTPTPTFMQPTGVGQSPQKRRRTDSVPINGNGLNVGSQRTQQFIQHEMSQTPMDPPHNITQTPPQSVHIPKRGARACTACRKGKNRCEGEVLEHQLCPCACRAIR